MKINKQNCSKPFVEIDQLSLPFRQHYEKARIHNYHPDFRDSLHIIFQLPPELIFWEDHQYSITESFVKTHCISFKNFGAITLSVHVISSF